MKTLVLLLSLSSCLPLLAAEHRLALVRWRGVQEFGKAKTENTMSAAIREQGVSGGVIMPSIFLHPEGEGRAVASFERVSWGLEGGLRVFFVGYVGLSDGVKWDDKVNVADGARFYVMLDGKDVASAEVKESQWSPLAAQLYEAPAGNGTFEGALALATDSGPAHNASYDWALFGEPMLVALDGRPLPVSTAVSGVNGVFIAQVNGGAGKIVLEGLTDRGDPIPDAVATIEVPQGATGLQFAQFDFSQHAGCSAWRWRPEGVTVASAWGGSLQPRLALAECGLVQGFALAGEPLRVRVSVRNYGPGALLPEHGAAVECNGKRELVERMPPDSRTHVDFDLGLPGAGPVPVQAMAQVGGASDIRTLQIDVWPSLPRLPEGRPAKARAVELARDYLLLENPHCRWLINRRTNGRGALVYAWIGDHWELSGSVAPWVALVSTTGGDRGLPSFPEVEARPARGGVQLEARYDGARFAVALDAFLPDDSPALRMDLSVEAREPTKLAAVWGPAVHAGDRGTGAQKGIALFPGLDYLEGKEQSSSTRDLAPPLNERWTPHKFKITVPMMMVETRDGGPVMAVVWDPKQKWDGEHAEPAACFASPDFVTHQDSHLMQLMLPSVPDSIAESQRAAGEPIELQPGKPWKLTQFIVAGVPKPDATAALNWFGDLVGYPDAETWPRSFEDEIALCRHAFLNTVWDPEKQGSRHVIGWASANAPGHAALMLMDARTVAQGEAKTQLLDRVKLVAEKTVKEEGPAGLASPAQCHIMGWEFPYHWGYLPEALAGMEAMAYGALNSQEDDGGWGYYPDAERKRLGEPGTRVMGIAGRNAYLMAKWVAISGDPVVEQALRHALQHMETYRVPRGAQGWECPILEPDVLASAYAVRAYVWAYMALGDKALLDKARFWARTGLPFQYAWDDGGHPGMRYSSIPVFGSTFFTHTWIGLPVQWCGLVYAYGLQELMRFDPNDLWRKQAEGMTISGMVQQWPMDSKEFAGTYPDSYGQWFTHRNPVFINPENIQLNLMALRGLDPGLRSVAVSLGGGPVHVTAPGDLKAKATGRDGLTVELKYLPGETCYVTIAPVAAEGLTVKIGDESLLRRETLAAGETGWAYDAQLRVLAIGVKADGQGLARLALSGLACSVPELPKTKATWDFDQDTEGWTVAHSCELKAENGHLVLTVTGEDAYASSGPAAIKAGEHRRLRVSARLTGGSSLALFWRSTRSPGWGPDKEVHADLPANGQWHEVLFDLSRHPLWIGAIQQIRLDPEGAGLAPGVVLEVDWIRAE